MALLILILLLLVAAAVAVAITVHRDGYGHRPPPRSHPADLFDPASANRAGVFRHPRTRMTG